MAPRNEKRRNEIMKVSFRLFGSEPYEKVSFSKIAAGAGINKSLLQHYYGKKSELVGTMLNELLETAFSFMDTLSFEAGGDDEFQKISDFNMLFFKSVDVNDHMRQFITESVSQPELLDAWIESICKWLWSFLDRARFKYIQIRTAMYFSMGGSMHLFLHQDELGLDYIYICRTHIRSILSFLDYDADLIKKICRTTDERIGRISAEDFLNYCQSNISWLEI